MRIISQTSIRPIRASNVFFFKINFPTRIDDKNNSVSAVEKIDAKINTDRSVKRTGDSPLDKKSKKALFGSARGNWDKIFKPKKSINEPNTSHIIPASLSPFFESLLILDEKTVC